MLNWLTKENKESKKSQDTGEKTLCDCTDGECVQIEQLHGDANDCQRLREMGFCESARVEKITESGALICKVCESKVVISQQLAKNVIVGDCSEKQGDFMNESQANIVLLSKLNEGQEGTIHDFVEENDTCARLEEMGVTPGESIQVVRYAPLGDPIEIKVRGYLLSLRKEEAELIQVQL